MQISKFRYKNEGEKGAPLMKLTTKYLAAKWKQMHSRSLVSNSYIPVTYVRIITTLSDNQICNVYNALIVNRHSYV